MKISPLTMIFPRCPPRRPTALALTAELCLRAQKNQLRWLASSPSDPTALAARLFFCSPLAFNPRFLSSTCLLKLQVASQSA